MNASAVLPFQDQWQQGGHLPPWTSLPEVLQRNVGRSLKHCIALFH